MTWGSYLYFDEEGKPVDIEEVVQHEELKMLAEIASASPDAGSVIGSGKNKNPKPRFINGKGANRWRGLGYRGRRR